MNLLKDIDAFFNGVGSSITGSTSKLAADIVKKTVAVGHVATHLVEVFGNDVETAWHTLDNTPVATLVENAVAQLNAGNFEKAALNVIYLIYQKAIEETRNVSSIVDVAVNTVAPAGITTKLEDGLLKVVHGVENEVKTVVDKVEGFFGHSTTPALASTPVPSAAPIPTLTDVVTAAPAPAAAATPVALSVVTPAKPQLAG